MERGTSAGANRPVRFRLGGTSGRSPSTNLAGVGGPQQRRSCCDNPYSAHLSTPSARFSGTAVLSFALLPAEHRCRGPAVNPEGLALALGIVALRSIGVGVGTVRIAMVVQSRRGLAALVGFWESVLFVVPAAIVFSGLDDPIRMVAYSLGFALGQYLGLTATDWLRVGSTTVRIFLPAGPSGLAEALRARGFGVTVFDGEGREGTVRVVHVVLPRRRLPEFLGACVPWRERCFVTVGDSPVTLPHLSRPLPHAALGAGRQTARRRLIGKVPVQLASWTGVRR